MESTLDIRSMCALYRVSDEGRELLVAASFALHAREAVAAGRCGNQRKRWLTYCRLYKKVIKHPRANSNIHIFILV